MSTGIEEMNRTGIKNDRVNLFREFPPLGPYIKSETAAKRVGDMS